MDSCDYIMSNEEEEAAVRQMVTAREALTENYLRDVIASLPVPSNASAAELGQIWKKEALARIGSASVTLSHRVDPILKLLLDQKMSQTMSRSFVTIEEVSENLSDLVDRYTKCFNAWIDADKDVSFKATNTRLLGNVTAKDMFILTFFAFCTCRRLKNDNLLQLGLVGCSTSGKSTLFESCLMEGSHVTTNEQGVGRFQVGDKPVLLFHDIDVRTLAMSKDTEKIKTIARTEPTVSKVHSNVITLPPLFLFYSSNERLMSHRFSNHATLTQPRIYASQVNVDGKKKCSAENLTALQNRFIEAFVRSPPPLNVQDLPRCGGFQRIHGVLGMYDRIIQILQHYQPSDIYSLVLIKYVLHGLATNVEQFNQLFGRDERPTLKQLMEKYSIQSAALAEML
jgi:hypothetical protein